ncbi:CHAT domain-containing protein [Chloroflexota bacterium]
MSQQVSIMVLPTGSAEALPQVLLEQAGVWRDMSPPLVTRALGSVTLIRRGIDALLTEIMQQMRGGALPAFAVLKATFRRQYNMIVPPGIQQAFQHALDDAAPGEAPLLNIHIHTSTEWIPWEILHDGTDFLGLRFRIARLPITPTGPKLDSSAPRIVDRITTLLAQNVFDAPVSDQLIQSWKGTFDGFLPAAVQSVNFPSLNGAGSNYPNVDHFMNTAVDSDIVLVTCHGGLKDDQGQYYWTLNHQSPLTFTYRINATILGDLDLANNPLVFGNACDSQAAGSSGLSPGFGSVFFAQGALAFVGTFAPITQKMAVEFAKRFFRSLLGAPAISISQALWEAKQYFSEQDAPDPSYLYYSLYRPAETVFRAA